MDDLIKNEKIDIDCRALSEPFLSEFMEGGKYEPFVKLVKKYKDELELCFRGNNLPSEAVCIYYNNHLVYKIESNGNITINFDHARYSKDYNTYWTMINQTYEFNTNAPKEPRIKVKVNKRKKTGDVSYSTEVSYITAPYNESIKNNVERIYVDCIRKMLIDSFDTRNTKDYFREKADKTNDKYKGQLSQSGRKAIWLEKVRQQQLFAKMKHTTDGYFFFDMEFSQKSLKDSDQYGEALSNEPDMLAIFFDSNGLPKKYTFVEVKCTNSAYTGKSGMVAHLQKMKEYPVEYMEARLREAALVLKQYEKLGFYSFAQPVQMADYMKLVSKKPENLFVFTDDALDKFRCDNCNEIIDFKKNAKKKEEIDIHISGCKEIEFWEL